MVMKAWEGVLAMELWKEHFETLPPNLKLAVLSNLQFLDLELKELPKELKYLFLGEGKTFPVIISSTLDESQEDKLKMLLKQPKGAIG